VLVTWLIRSGLGWVLNKKLILLIYHPARGYQLEIIAKLRASVS